MKSDEGNQKTGGVNNLFQILNSIVNNNKHKHH